MFLVRLVALAVVGASLVGAARGAGHPTGVPDVAVDRQHLAAVHGGQSVRLRGRGFGAGGQDRNRPFVRR